MNRFNLILIIFSILMTLAAICTAQHHGGHHAMHHHAMHHHAMHHHNHPGFWGGGLGGNLLLNLLLSNDEYGDLYDNNAYYGNTINGNVYGVGWCCQGAQAFTNYYCRNDRNYYYYCTPSIG